MPTIVTRGAGSARGFGFSQLSTSAPGWIYAYYFASTAMQTGPLAFNASGQILSLGWTGSKDGILTISKSGTTVSQIENTTGNMRVSYNNPCYFDTTNGFLYFASEFASGIGTAKMSPSSQTYSWTRYATGNFTNYTPESNGITVDSSQNVYACGVLTQNTGCCNYVYFGTILKQNSSGTLTYVALYNEYAGATVSFKDVVLTTSQSPTVAGNTNISAGYSVGIIMSFTSTLTENWKKQFSIGTNNIYFYSLDKDSSNNYYVCAYNAANGNILTLKYNSSGVLQWQQTFYAGIASYATKIKVSAAGDIYVMGTTSASKNPLILLKYNNSGVLQWQRLFTPSGALVVSGTGGLLVDDTNNSIVFTFGIYNSNLGSGYVRLIIRYSMDGSKLGTYAVGSSSIVISASSGTSSASSGVDANSTITYRSTPATSGVGPTLTYSSVSYSSSLTVI